MLRSFGEQLRARSINSASGKSMSTGRCPLVYFSGECPAYTLIRF